MERSFRCANYEKAPALSAVAALPPSPGAGWRGGPGMARAGQGITAIPEGEVEAVTVGSRLARTFPFPFSFPFPFLFPFPFPSA